jgi:hypothetical protein
MGITPVRNTSVLAGPWLNLGSGRFIVTCAMLAVGVPQSILGFSGAEA